MGQMSGRTLHCFFAGSNRLSPVASDTDVIGKCMGNGIS